MKKSDNLPLKLLVGIVVGIIAGLFLPESAMTIVVTLKYVLNQVIMFCVPLIVIGFIAPPSPRWAPTPPGCWAWPS